MLTNSEQIDYRKYLDPKVISKISSMDLKARMIVEGFLLGLHRSPFHGFSIEFAQHRQYMQGDALKDVDWKVFAKTDRYYVKQYEEETNLRSYIFLDTSKSMAYSSGDNISKLEYSKMLVAALSYISLKQKDAVGLSLYSNEIIKTLPPKASNNYLKEIITSLHNVKPDTGTNTALCLNKAAESIKKRGLVIVVSDFFDDIDSVLKVLKQFRFMKNEVIVFQVLDPMEVDFGFERDSVFVDLESNQEMTSQPYQIKKAYREAMTKFTKKIKDECINSGIEYNLLNTSTGFDKALFAYLQKRSRLY
jgi:uncharacterized protein (DUF58 family)